MENNELLLPVYTEHRQGLFPTEKQNGFPLSGSIEFAAVFESFFMSTSSDFDIMPSSGKKYSGGTSTAARFKRNRYVTADGKKKKDLHKESVRETENHAYSSDQVTQDASPICRRKRKLEVLECDTESDEDECQKDSRSEAFVFAALR